MRYLLLLLSALLLSVNVSAQRSRINKVKAGAARPVHTPGEAPSLTLEEQHRLNKVENSVDDVLKLSLNPSKGNFTVNFSAVKSQTARLRILDLTGRVLYVREIPASYGPNTFEVSQAGLVKGVYVLNLVLEEVDAHRKIIVY